MKKHIKKATNDFDEDIVRNAPTPARPGLFYVNEWERSKT